MALDPALSVDPAIIANNQPGHPGGHRAERAQVNKIATALGEDIDTLDEGTVHAAILNRATSADLAAASLDASGVVAANYMPRTELNATFVTVDGHIADQQDQIDAIVLSGGLQDKGVWDIGTAYPASALVEHEGSQYISNDDTIAGEEPGVSGKWRVFSTGVDVTARAAASEALTQLVGQLRPINPIPYPVEFENAWWTKQFASITDTDLPGPIAGAQARRLVENTDSTTHRLTRAAVGDGTEAVWSMYGHAAERRGIFLGRGWESADRASFDLETGTVVQQGANVLAAAMEDVGGGWWRCSIRAAITDVYFGLLSTTVGYLGDGVSSVLVWGGSLQPLPPAGETLRDLRTWFIKQDWISLEVTDATTEGWINTADVVWPDWSPGVLTVTDRNADGHVLAFNVTHDLYGVTVAQPTITVDVNGNATFQPLVTVEATA